MKDQRKYESLHKLLADNGEARAYFESLPNWVKESIQERSGGVNSYESLCNYADKLTQGDH